MYLPSSLITVLGTLTLAEALRYTETILINSGSIRGEEVESAGVKYKSFKGIPYAAPPTGESRFKSPEPADVWDDIKDVVKFGHVCYQPVQVKENNNDADDYKVNSTKIQVNVSAIAEVIEDQSEDCLYINVYTKEIRIDADNPVLVWIHGGGFFSGDGTDVLYGPEYLVSQDIVVVSFNYRLGPLGFLAMNTSDATGNWGLKDQVAALKWVHDNIAQFGGSPNKVTIYGSASGGSSVHFHLMSPLSKGLFQRAIISSGTATSDLEMTNQHKRFAKNLGRILGAPTETIDDPEQLLTFLKNADPKEMTEKFWDVLEDEDIKNNVVLPFPFTPVLESADTEEAFMTEDPKTLLAEGRFQKVSLMIGFNDVEGGLAMDLPQFQSTESMKMLNEDPCLVLPLKLRDAIKAKGGCETVSKYLRDLYFGGKSLGNEPLNFTYLIGDSILASEIHRAQKWHAHYTSENNSVYYYYFTYDGDWNLMKIMFDFDQPGAVQGDDLTYVFMPHSVKLPQCPKAKLVKDRMISFISNFVKSGNPTPKKNELVPIMWEPATEKKLQTMHIDAGLKMEINILKPRMDFWDHLYKKYIGTSLYL